MILRSGAVTAAVGVGLSLAALPAVPASAATGGTRVPCNDITALKNAITKANSSGPNSAGSHITLASHCTYTLTAPDNADDGLPEITGHVTISGRDTTIRRAPDATQNFRIFHVRSTGNLTLNSLTVSGGRVSGGVFGGGIFVSSGALNLNRTTIKGNQTDQQGGGLSNLAGRVNLDRSIVERNTARFGGGMENNGGGTLTMNGGSLRNNRGTAGAGGFLNAVGTASLQSVSVRGNTGPEGGGIYNTASMRLTSTTVRDNIAVSGAGLLNTGSATLVRSLVTRNTAITVGGGILNRGAGRVTLTDSKVVRNRPDNCSPAGSVPGCTDPASATTLPAKDGKGAKDSKVVKVAKDGKGGKSRK